jgi:DNA repair protein RecN (Recombination protein N)
LREQLLGGQTLTPGGDSHRYLQRVALAVKLDLDGMQPAESAPRDDLPAPLVGAGKHHQQLSLGGVTDAIEATQLAAERDAQVDERLCRQLLAVGERQLLDVIEADEQAAQGGTVTLGPTDLFVQAHRQLGRGEAVAGAAWGLGGVLGVSGSHADGWTRRRRTAFSGGSFAGTLRLSTNLLHDSIGDLSVCAGTPVRVLCELRVENLLLIERAELALAPGLNVLTGETGAGKTVLAHALDLLMGGRSRAGIVRPGCEEAYVEGVFAVPRHLRKEVDLLLPENVRIEGSGEAAELLLARRVGADGRTRAYINGRSAGVGDLRELGALLISFYGQHEHRKLTLASAQLQMLDGICGAEHARRLQACAASYRETRRLESELERLGELGQVRERELELLEHELAEIEAAAPDGDEHETLLKRRERLRGLDALRAAAGKAADALAPESFDGPGGASLLAGAAAQLETIAGIDAELDALAGRCAALAIEAQDVAGALRGYCESVEAEDGSLESVEERLATLDRVMRKHGGSISSVIEYAEQARLRREQLLGATVAQKHTVESLAAERVSLDEHVVGLRKERKGAATRLAKAVRGQLAALAMADASFEIALTAVAPKADGGDAVEFVIAPNPGVAATALRETASGGELSRVMLALASACAEGGEAELGSSKSTLVFDEVDAGIGGHTARAVGERLQTLAQGRQVLCITHLPQIASLAARHFSVAKDTSADPTVATVVQLAEREVVTELVRMLGAEEQDGAARRHARELRRAA